MGISSERQQLTHANDANDSIKLKQEIKDDIHNGVYTCLKNHATPIYKFNLNVLDDNLGKKLLEELILGNITEKQANLLLEKGAQVNKINLSGKHVIEYLYEKEFFDLVVKCVEHGAVVPRRLFLKCISKSSKKKVGQTNNLRDFKFYDFRLLDAFYKYGCDPLTTEETLQLFSQHVALYDTLKNNNNMSLYLDEDTWIKSFQKRMQLYLKVFNKVI